jgi:hypothetical protein
MQALRKRRDWMDIFGHRDSGLGSRAGGVLPPLQWPEEPATPTEIGPSGPGAAEARRVILRVAGDDDIVVGSAEGRDNAVQIARNMVLHIEQAAVKGEWPQIDERFIRPGAIVSIDVQRAG